MDESDIFAARTGVAADTVAKILAVQVDLLLALGLAHPDDEDRGRTLRAKYPAALCFLTAHMCCTKSHRS